MTSGDITGDDVISITSCGNPLTRVALSDRGTCVLAGQCYISLLVIEIIARRAFPLPRHIKRVVKAIMGNYNLKGTI